MTNIALDTNIWIYLTKETFHELWIKLKEGKANKEFDIIVNEIILKEWERNKATTIKSLNESIKQEYKAAKNLLRNLPDSIKKNIEEGVNFYKEENNRLTRAKNKVQEVEDFMKSCTMIPITSDQKLYVANLAIEKYPPFQNNKNNFNDALIIRNIAEFVKGAIPWQYDLIYVSNNPDDFTNKETKDIHTDLLKGLEHIRIKNVSELGQALDLAPELIDDFDAWLEQALDDQAM